LKAGASPTLLFCYFGSVSAAILRKTGELSAPDRVRKVKRDISRNAVVKKYGRFILLFTEKYKRRGVIKKCRDYCVALLVVPTSS
jgi:hypothetical protein